MLKMHMFESEKHMDIKEYLKELQKKVNCYDKKAKNPFLEYNYAHNPFKSAVSETKVWVEEIKDKKNPEGEC